MTYLSSDNIRRLITDGVWITTKDGRKLKRPLVEPADGTKRIEGAAFDLSLAEVYRQGTLGPADTMAELDVYHKNAVRIDRKDRNLPKAERLQSDDAGFFHLKYGTAYLLETVETLAVPESLLCRLLPKTSLARSFCQLTVSDAHPNFLGKIHGLLTVWILGGIYLQRGALWCSARWAEFDGGNVDSYRGQWGEQQGNRPTSNGEEIPAK